MTRAIALAAGVVLAPPALALAYEAIPVESGGAVSGTVTLVGSPPAVPPAVMPRSLAAADRSFCEKKKPLVSPYYRVGPRRGLADVVVWIEGIERGRAPSRKDAVIANRDCRFVPTVQTIDVGAKLQVENRDPILHNTHPIYEGSKVTAFNIGMPRAGQVVKKKIRQPGILRVQCDAGHVWMRAWVHAFKHPYHTVTAADGSYALRELPPGEYALKAWHEAAGTWAGKVKVTASGAARVDFSMSAR
jgi:hypothetical protein